MATMIPENVEQFTTEGEKQFYRFLESVAKPDSQYIAWYTPDLKGRGLLNLRISKYNIKNTVKIFILIFIMGSVQQSYAEESFLFLKDGQHLKKDTWDKDRINVIDKTG